MDGWMRRGIPLGQERTVKCVGRSAIKVRDEEMEQGSDKEEEAA